MEKTTVYFFRFKPKKRTYIGSQWSQARHISQELKQKFNTKKKEKSKV